MTPQEDLDNRMKENLPNSKDNKQVEAITEDTSSDTDFSLVGKLPVISDEGEQHSPSSFPLVSVSPQPVAEEEFNEDMAVEPLFLCGVLQEVPMSHKFATLIRTT